ncbi:MAG TPA: multidrug efflux SMR transporter [Terriglobia bacterium]|nr:multidrug efflux SMR transporter [Terriglobia bacterium]
MHWLYLAIAILSEVVATSALKAAEGFTRGIPSLLVVVGYGLSFHFLSLTLRSVPLGIAYAIWSGVGVALVSLAGWLIYHQSLDTAALAGITLIVTGVVVLNLFSKSVLH